MRKAGGIVLDGLCEAEGVRTEEGGDEREGDDQRWQRSTSFEMTRLVSGASIIPGGALVGT